MSKKAKIITVLTLLFLVAGTAGFIIFINYSLEPGYHVPDPAETGSDIIVAAPSPGDDRPGDSLSTQTTPSPEPSEIPDYVEIPDEPPILVGLPDFEPFAIPGTDPDIMVASTGIMADGQIVDSFTLPDRIDFGFGSTYSWYGGITTFRGNNFRDSASYGYADIRNGQFGDTWFMGTSSLTAPDGYTWAGVGWTGQPLIVEWPEQTRHIMNMHQWAKDTDGLIEVILSALDGYVYFAQLETGRATRDPLFIGYTFKGAGAIDPRGYPLLYVGAGYASARGLGRIFVISLIDGSILHTFGNSDGFAPRGWNAHDSSPLVDADTDQLIYPSENGVIYILKLNSFFSPEDGTMTIEPSAPVKWRFVGKRSHAAGKYWLGFEASPAIWRGHLFIPDNGGHLICLDLNTLQLVWVQDVLDDSNSSPVLELENGHPYLYISTSFHGGWRAPTDSSAPIPIWKIDAMTGEIVWRVDYICYTASGVSGGVQGSIALGKNDLSDLIFVPVARTPSRGRGILTALDKQTGDIVWEFNHSAYGWSSPVCVYTESGKGYVVFATSDGRMHLIDGITGVVLDSILIGGGGTIEASPAVYNSTVIVGTRALRIWGVQLT